MLKGRLHQALGLGFACQAARLPGAWKVRSPSVHRREAVSIAQMTEIPNRWSRVKELSEACIVPVQTDRLKCISGISRTAAGRASV